MNIHEQVLVQRMFLFLQDRYLAVELLAYMTYACFWKNCHSIFKNGCTIFFIFPPAMGEGSGLSTP